MTANRILYSAERKQKVITRLQSDAHVTVSDLASVFGVSRATIRRDLCDLHASGVLRRTYGGAVPLDRPTSETPIHERMVIHREEKERIGQYAARLISSGQTIFLDGGSTVECIVPHLAQWRHLTAVTFGLNIINRLVCCDNITAIVLGGTLDRRSLTIGGALGNESLGSYGVRFDKAFIAASGVSADEGVTNASFEEIPMKRRAIEVAREVILVADASKVGVVATGLIVPVSRIHRLVTGRQASADHVARIRNQGVIVDLV